MYAYRIKKYIGAYFAVLGRVDAIVFTAGIGENSAEIRARSCAGLSGLGIEIDPEKNGGRLDGVCEIHAGRYAGEGLGGAHQRRARDRRGDRRLHSGEWPLKRVAVGPLG